MIAPMGAWIKKAILELDQTKEKLYSLHAPEVECIAKGKAHKRYEFGCKVSVVTTCVKPAPKHEAILSDYFSHQFL